MQREQETPKRTLSLMTERTHAALRQTYTLRTPLTGGDQSASSPCSASDAPPGRRWMSTRPRLAAASAWRFACSLAFFSAREPAGMAASLASIAGASAAVGVPGTRTSGSQTERRRTRRSLRGLITSPGSAGRFRCMTRHSSGPGRMMRQAQQMRAWRSRICALLHPCRGLGVLLALPRAWRPVPSPPVSSRSAACSSAAASLIAARQSLSSTACCTSCSSSCARVRSVGLLSAIVVVSAYMAKRIAS